MGSNSGDGIQPGKIFVGGLAGDTNLDTFIQHFQQYGQMKDYVIIREPNTGQSRGFGFVTFAVPSAVDAVLKDGPHVINGKTVEIKRALQNPAENTDYFKKKIFVGGIARSVTEAEFKDFFSNYGTVVNSQIICDRETKQSRGFGFIEFQSEEEVNDMLHKGPKLGMPGGMVEIKRARRYNAPNPTSGPAFGSDYRTDPSLGAFDGSVDYGRYGGGGPDFVGSLGYYGSYGDGGPDFAGSLGDYGSYGGGGPDFVGSLGYYGSYGGGAPDFAGSLGYYGSYGGGAPDFAGSLGYYGSYGGGGPDFAGSYGGGAPDLAGSLGYYGSYGGGGPDFAGNLGDYGSYGGGAPDFVGSLGDYGSYGGGGPYFGGRFGAIGDRGRGHGRGLPVYPGESSVGNSSLFGFFGGSGFFEYGRGYDSGPAGGQ